MDLRENSAACEVQLEINHTWGIDELTFKPLKTVEGIKSHSRLMLILLHTFSKRQRSSGDVPEFLDGMELTDMAEASVLFRALATIDSYIEVENALKRYFPKGIKHGGKFWSLPGNTMIVYPANFYEASTVEKDA